MENEKPKYQDEIWLKTEILISKKTATKIAKENGWSASTVLKWQRHFGIIEEYKNHKWLQHQFLDLNKTALEISREQHCSSITINKYLCKFNIKKSYDAAIQAKILSTKRTCIDRYQVDNPMKLANIKQRVKITSKDKYGEEHFLKTNTGREKLKESIKQKYGCDYITQTPEVKLKIKETVMNKYGVCNVSMVPEIAKKKRQTLICLHGFNPATEQTGLCRVINGLTTKELAEKHNVPYSSLNYIFRTFHIETEESLEAFLSDYKIGPNNLEKYLEDLIDLPHWNIAPENVKLSYRPDFRLSNSIYLNVDGLYWHSDKFKDKNYHYKMREEFESAGLQIVQFRADEIHAKPKIIKSIINNKAGKSQKISARKTIIKKVSHENAMIFLNESHIKGYKAAKHIGLYFENILVMICSYKIINKILKIERLATLLDHLVVGGASKLFKFLERNLKFDMIHYWVDLRYGKGDFLSSMGFSKNKDVLGWEWTDYVKTYNRLQCRANMDDRGLSQSEHACELGWVKIYDAGQRLWIKQNNLR